MTDWCEECGGLLIPCVGYRIAYWCEGCGRFFDPRLNEVRLTEEVVA